MGPIPTEPCERLPFPFAAEYIKFTRGFQAITPSWVFMPSLYPQCDPNVPHHNHALCPVCNPPSDEHYLMWVGKTYYTPKSFLEEAQEMGISKRIANIPDGLVIGKTWVYLCHLESGAGAPGCFAAFKPTHVDLVVEDENEIPEIAESLNERLDGHLRIVKVLPEEEEDAEQ